VSDASRRFAAGATWLYGHRGVERLLDFAATVVLARILSPEDFGLVAIAASVVAIVEGLSAFDVNRALIRTRDDDRALYDTAWTLSALRGLAAALVMLAVASLVADARVGAVLSVMALGPLVGGLANPRFVAFERDLVYSRLAALTLVARVASVAATLLVAVLYRSYWALVIGLLVGTATSTVLSYALRPYRPRPTLARSSELAAFSGWLSLATVVTTLSMETDRIIVGGLLGIAEAGLYFMTVSVGALPTRELVSPLQRMLFPSFSDLASERERLRRAAVESVNVLGSLSLAAGCGFALVANDFVPLALGGQWRPIVPLLVVLVPYLGLRATLSMALPCVMALGRTRLLAGVSLAYAVVHLPVFVAGTALFGLRGAVGAIVTAGVLYSYMNAWMLRRTLDVTLGEILGQLRRPLVAAVLMAAAVLALGAASPPVFFSSEGSWISLVLKVAVGAAAYAAALFAQWHREGRPAGIERRLIQLISR
jgi:PST family polysaccharide transporter